MPCTHVNLPGGGTAIVCTTSRTRPRCACGKPAPLLCDWKVDAGTCDTPICAACSTRPARDKDLCPTHAKAWKAWKSNRGDR